MIKELLSFRKYKWMLVPILVALFYAFFAGSMVTFDGNQYLATAHSLQLHSFTKGYLFGRPPFYPFFLTILLDIYNSDRFLIFIQVLMITLSLNLFYIQLRKSVQAIYKVNLPNWLLLFLLFLPTVTGYGTTVLQQTFFIVETNLILWILLRAINTPRQMNFLYLSILSPIVVFTGQGLIPFLFAAVSISVILAWRFRAYATRLTKYSLVALILVLPISEFAWSAFQNWGKTIPESTTLEIPSGQLLVHFPSYVLKNPSLAVNNFLDDYVTQAGLAPAMQAKGLINSPTPGFYENRVHAEAAFDPNRNCGIRDSNPYGGSAKIAANTLIQHCTLLQLPFGFTYFVFSLGLIAPFASFLFIPLGFTFALIAYKRRNWTEFTLVLILLVPHMILRISYLLLGFQPDRYAVQSIPTAIIFLFLIFSKLTIIHREKVNL